MNPGLLRRVRLAVLTIFLAAGFSAGQDIPVRNWDVPGGEMSKQALGTPSVFSPIDPPCRLYDSRVTSGGPGPIPGSASRNFDFVPSGSTSCGSLPSNVVALSLFFTVLAPQGPGFIYAWPGPTPPGSPTSIVNYNGTPGEIRNNAAIVTVDPATGSFNVTAGVSGTELIIDLNGIFFNELPSTHQLFIRSSIPGTGAIVGENNANSNDSAGVLGLAGGNNTVHGVRGQLGPSVFAGSAGVHGRALVAPSAQVVYGGHFLTNSTVTNSAGVLADNNSTTGRVFGLIGDNDSSGNGSAGVVGRSGINDVTFPYNETIGVLGTSVFSGNPNGNVGAIGHAEGPPPLYGVYGYIRYAQTGFTRSGALGHSSFGVYSFDDIGAVGTKSFVEPHPTDPALEIAYISLEGNEAGTYFRGRGRFQNGLARIAVPEDFRLVSEADGLSIQVTPIGDMASFAVVRIGLDEIVVKASRNVEFFYLVNGVRRRHAGHEPIRKNTNFVPNHPGDKMHRWPDWVKQRLIENGTLTREGTPNLETAERLGWKATWEKHAAEAAEARARAAANPEKTSE